MPSRQYYSLFTVFISGIICILTTHGANTIKQFNQAFAGKEWGYGWTHGVTKVFRDRLDCPFDGKIAGTCSVELAANEWESFQIIIRSHKNIRNIQVKASKLVSENGNYIKKSQITISPVGYVNTANGAKKRYDVDYKGWWPDPILNFISRFNLDANVWQPLWVEIKTSPNQSPGVYTGKVTITGDNVLPLVVPISVLVWGFSVPEIKHFPTTLTFRDREFLMYSRNKLEWNKFNKYYVGECDLDELGKGEARHLYELRRKCIDLMLQHSIFPDNIYRRVPPRLDDLKYWVSKGMPCFNIVHVPNVGRNCKFSQPYPEKETKRILNVLRNIVPKLKKEKLLKKAYIYAFDEIGPNQYHAARDILSKIKKLYPMIPIMTTANDKSYGLKSKLDPFVDIWVPLTDKYSKTQKQIAAARKRGRQIWWYLACNPHHPYANWLVEYSSAEQRLTMGFMPFKFKPQGFLYYEVNLWRTFDYKTDKDGKIISILDATLFSAPLKHGPLTNMSGETFPGTTGDGLIFYPGPNGPVPTIRLKNIRDGIEDYEYLCLLKKLIKQVRRKRIHAPKGWLKQACCAVTVNDNLVKSMTEYSTSGMKLLKERRNIAKLIEKVVSK